MTAPERYLVLAAQPWAQAVPLPPGDWTRVARPDELGQPGDWARVFALHWHWKLSPAWTDTGRVIGFHASDLPRFRGGAPIENQQRRGITHTQLTAYRMDRGWDTGPILLQRPLSLAGTREDVLTRIAALIPGMLADLLAGRYTERAQVGEGSFYRRQDVPPTGAAYDVGLTAGL